MVGATVLRFLAAVVDTLALVVLDIPLAPCGACCPSPDDVPDLGFLIGLAPLALLASWRGSRTRARRERHLLRDRFLLPTVIHPVVAGSAADLPVPPPDRRWVRSLPACSSGASPSADEPGRCPP